MNFFILNHERETEFYNGPSYNFKNQIGKTIRWPINDGSFLGPAGIWNILNRFELKPISINFNFLDNVNKCDFLFIHASGKLNIKLINKIAILKKKGVKIIASGRISEFKCFFENISFSTKKSNIIFSGLAIKTKKNLIQLIAPNNWSYVKVLKKNKEYFYGSDLVLVSGNINNPKESSKCILKNSPSFIQNKNFKFLNCNPFAAFQAWLQGQNNLEIWSRWRDENHWLDLQSLFILENLVFDSYKFNFKDAFKNSSNKKINLIFRHDVDSSRDLSYLNETKKNNLKSVYAVLMDKNLKFWLSILNDNKLIENSFHYYTIKDNIFSKILEKLPIYKNSNIKKHRKNIAQGGLTKQVLRAKNKGIGIRTLNRHFSNFFYPEYIYEFFQLENYFKEFLGASSFFECKIFRWGSLEIDGINSSNHKINQSQFSFWKPFKLADASNFGQLSKGFENCAISEPEPKHAINMLRPINKKLSDKTVTLIFHPYHANNNTFVIGGSLNWFKKIVNHVTNKPYINVVKLSELLSSLKDNQ